jgi:hypothetical protein
VFFPRFCGLVIALYFCQSAVAIAGVLDDAASEAYVEYAACVKSTRDPSKCLDEYVDYIRAAQDVLRVDADSAEKARVSQSFEFLERSATKFLEVAKDRGDPEIAERARRIFSLLSKIRKSKAVEYQVLIDEARVYADAQDLVIRLKAWLPRFTSDLDLGMSPSKEHSVYVAQLEQSYDVLPSSLKQDIQASWIGLDAWLDRYLTETVESPSLVSPQIFADRIALYRSAMRVPIAMASREPQIEDAEAYLIESLNETAAAVIRTLEQKEQTWRNSISGGRVEIPRSVTTDASDLEVARAGALNSIRIIRESEQYWPRFSRDFEGDLLTLENSERWEGAAEVLALHSALYEEDLNTGFVQYQGFSSAAMAIHEPQSARNAIEASLTDLMLKQLQTINRDSLFDGVAYLHAVDAYAHDTFLDEELVRGWSLTLAKLLDDDAKFTGIDKVVAVYADLRAKHRQSPSVDRLYAQIVEFAEDSISEVGLEDIHAFGGLDLVMNTLDELPTAMERVDPDVASRIRASRYNQLLASDLSEVRLTADLYDQVVTKITDDDVEYYIDLLYEFAEWSEDNNSGQSNEGTLIYNVMAEGAESLYDRLLPLSRSVLTDRYPREVVSVCVLTMMADRAVSYDAVKNMVEGFDRYHPYTVLLNDEIEDGLALLNFAYQMQKRSGGRSISPPPDPLIDSGKMESFAFRSFSGIASNCLPRYPEGPND